MTDRINGNPVISSPNRVAYTDAQREAMGTLDEPLLIVACAGSGKTQVISQRIVETLKRPGVEPKNIVAFTFTDRSAAELKERVTTVRYPSGRMLQSV